MHTSEAQFYSAVALAAIFLGVLILVFIATMIRHQRRNVQLYKAKIRAEINTLEKERKRISTDLHDELGPILSAVRMQINHLQSTHEADKAIVSFANKHIDDLLAKTREISYNLLPNTLVRQGLAKAVQEYINKLADTVPLDITFNCSEHINLSKEESVNIYRIILEIIHNTIKHAKAKNLMIRLQAGNNTLALITADDGVGFDYDKKIEQNKGLGLVNLQSRAEILNAIFNHKSELGYGTQYVFEIPINTMT